MSVAGLEGNVAIMAGLEGHLANAAPKNSKKTKHQVLCIFSFFFKKMDEIHRRIRNNECLEYIHVTQDLSLFQIDTLCQLFIDFPNCVRELVIVDVPFFDKHMRALTRMITYSSAITRIDLFDLMFTVDFYMYLAQALRVNTSLATIVIFEKAGYCLPLAANTLVSALRYNLNRPVNSTWVILNANVDIYPILKQEAQRGYHPQ